MSINRPKVPTLATLFETANRINTNYEKAIEEKEPDPTRLELKHEFSFLIKLISDLQKLINNEESDLDNILLKKLKIILKEKSQFNEEDLSVICQGAMVYVEGNIGYSYEKGIIKIKPDYRKIILNWSIGSRFYHEVTLELGQLTDKTKLICLGKLYNFIFKQPEVELNKFFNQKFRENNIDKSVLKTKIKEGIEYFLNHLQNHTSELLKLIPTERAIRENINKLLYNYIKKSLIEKNRLPDLNVIFFLKVLMSINRMLGYEQNNHDDKNFLSISQRRMMGILLADMKFIYNSYYYFSPDARSVRYKLYQETLNINKVEDIDKEMRLASFEAVKNMNIDLEKLENLVNSIHLEDCFAKLKLDKDIENLEETSRVEVYKLLETLSEQLKNPQPNYVDHEIIKIQKQNQAMLDEIEPNYKRSNVIKFIAGLAGIAGAVPGCVLGSLAGQGMGKVIGSNKFFLPAKTAVNYALGVVIGEPTQGFAGYFLSDYIANEIVKETLQRAFGLVFGAIGAAGLGGANGALTLMLSDLSYPTFKRVCQYYLGEHTKSKLAKDEDLEFIQCLLALPEEIFADDKKNKLQYNTEGRFFNYPYNRNKEPQIEEIEDNQIEHFTLI